MCIAMGEAMMQMSVMKGIANIRHVLYIRIYLGRAIVFAEIA